MRTIGKILLFSLTIFAIISLVNNVACAQEEPKESTGVEIAREVGTVITDATETLYNGVKTAVTDLAKALEVPATHVYEILVKQAFIIAVSKASIILFILIVLFTIAIRFGLIAEKYNDEESSLKGDPEGFHVGMTISLILAAFTLIWLVIDGGSIIAGIFNPEYVAIKEIVNMVK